MLVVAAFYRFVTLDSCREVKSTLEQIARTHDIYGTILLAHEGINGTVCGTRAAIDVLRNYFRAHASFKDLTYKESLAEKNPFIRRHIKIKKEIVTFDQPKADPRRKTGHHVNAQQWNDLLADPSVVVLDVRNRYETALGTFKGALDPNIETFKDFPDFVKNQLDPSVHKRIAMSCTGGIRCEKASAYMMELGFSEVYQLDGGVLQYLEDMPQNKSLWQGECFVFDHRVAVDHNLKPGSYSMCFSCRAPLSASDKLSPLFVEDVACPHCHEQLTEKKRKANIDRKVQIARARSVGKSHLGSHAMHSNARF